jgi:hypothetical protein
MDKITPKRPELHTPSFHNIKESEKVDLFFSIVFYVVWFFVGIFAVLFALKKSCII